MDQCVWTSWNENIQHEYTDLFKISSENDLRRILKSSNKIRVFGNKQSSSDICAGVETLIDLRSYNKLIGISKENLQITVQTGMLLSSFLKIIEDQGWCIPCLPDINTITVGGAIATGTHGTSGYIFAQYMCSCRLVLADGSVMVIDQKDELMDATRVSVGTLGILSEVTFQCEPNYTLHIKEGPQKDFDWFMKYKKNLANYDFYRVLWLPHTGYGYVITGEKIDKNKKIPVKLGPKHLQYRRSFSKFLYKHSNKYPWVTFFVNKILFYSFFNFKKEHKGSLYESTVTKSRGSTLELAEWTIGIDKFPDVFGELKKELQSWKNKSYVHIPMDIRFIRKDNSWLSYAYDQDTVTVGCVSRDAKTAESYEAFKSIEKIFIKHGGRPHWGKRFAAKDMELSKLYPKWCEFKALRKKLDPKNKFLNPYLASLFNEPCSTKPTQSLPV